MSNINLAGDVKATDISEKDLMEFLFLLEQLMNQYQINKVDIGWVKEWKKELPIITPN